MRWIVPTIAATSILWGLGCSTVVPFVPPGTGAASNGESPSKRSVETAAVLGRQDLEELGLRAITERKTKRATLLMAKTKDGKFVTIQRSNERSGFGYVVKIDPPDPILVEKIQARIDAGMEKSGATQRQIEISELPPPNKASAPRGSILQNSLEGGYRDVVAP